MSDWQAHVRDAVTEALNGRVGRVRADVARASVAEQYANEYLTSWGSQGTVTFERDGEDLLVLPRDHTH